jgi:predicted methyltransferase
MHDRRFNPSLAHRLDDPARLLWLPPDEVIAALGVQPGDMVADIGAGTGYFILPLARALGQRVKSGPSMPR